MANPNLVQNLKRPKPGNATFGQYLGRKGWLIASTTLQGEEGGVFIPEEVSDFISLDEFTPDIDYEEAQRTVDRRETPWGQQQ